MNGLNQDRHSLTLSGITDEKDQFSLRIFKGQNFVTVETLVDGVRQDIILSTMQLLELEAFIKKNKSLCQK